MAFRVEPGGGILSTFRPDPELFPFRSRWFDARGGRVHYIDEGEGPPLLFLHGNPTWSFLFRGVVIRLRRRFRCVALDYLGFGLSERPPGFGYTPREHADTVLQLVRHLDLQGLTIVGHDWGGAIGMRVALDETARLRGLVMSNTFYWPPDRLGMKAYGYVMSSAPMQRAILERNLMVETMLPKGVKHPLPARVLAHYAGVSADPTSRKGMAALQRHLFESSFWLGEIEHAVPRMLTNVPLLLAWGMSDFLVSPRFMERFREDFRNVTVRRLDARHFTPEDAPAEMSEAIESFLLPRSEVAAGA